VLSAGSSQGTAPTCGTPPMVSVLMFCGRSLFTLDPCAGIDTIHDRILDFVGLVQQWRRRNAEYRRIIDAVTFVADAGLDHVLPFASQPG